MYDPGLVSQPRFPVETRHEYLRLPLMETYMRCCDKSTVARSDAAWAWLDEFLTVERLKELLPEVADMPVDRYRLASIRSLNFVIHGLLEEGVAASTRQDPQAKSLGEWLRARVVANPWSASARRA